MTPQEFERAGQKLFGKKWKAQMSRALNRHPSMIWRYTTGQVPIPELVAFFISVQLLKNKK